MKSAFTRSRTARSSRSASSWAASNPNWIERSSHTFYEGAYHEALNDLSCEQCANVFLMPMSHMGHERTSWRVRMMSAYPQTRTFFPLWVKDICSAPAHVRFTTKANICSALPNVCFGPKANVCAATTLQAVTLAGSGLAFY